MELLHGATVQMKDLKRQQLELQEEIKIKENTIYIGKSLVKRRAVANFRFTKSTKNVKNLFYETVFR